MLRFQFEPTLLVDTSFCGLDLGHVTVEMDGGSFSSRKSATGSSHAVMLYLTVTMVLDGMRALIAGSSKSYAFVGAGAHLDVEFRQESGMIVGYSGRKCLGRATKVEVRNALLEAAERLALDWPLPDGDIAQDDFRAAIAAFRAIAIGNGL